jgi:AcrR family transcriptional regulator
MGRKKTIDDDEILRHARMVFVREGPAASTRDVARAARISQAVLFQRFGSKEEMFLKANTPKAPDVEGLLGAYPPGDARADLERMGGRIAEYLTELMPGLLHAVAQPDLGHARLLDLHRGLVFHPLVGALVARFERLQRDGLLAGADPAATAHAFLAMVHAAVFFDFLSHGSPGARHSFSIRALLRVLWVGLAPSGDRGPLPKRRARTKPR